MSFKQFYLKEEEKYFYHGSAYDFDKFDMTKIGSGDGLNKYGYGLYFADNEELAAYYAKENSIGKTKANMIYTVKLYGLDTFYEWESETPENIYACVIRKLEKRGLEGHAEEIKHDNEEYGDRWSIQNLYNWLKVVLKSEPKTTEFLYTCELNGTIADDIHGRGKIYVAYSDDIIKIVDKRSL